MCRRRRTREGRLARRGCPSCCTSGCHSATCPRARRCARRCGSGCSSVRAVPALHASAHHDASPPSPQVAGGALPAGELPRDALPALYSLGLVRYDVPVAACDRIAVPPLKGFVMNRVGHDYLEKMLYEVIPVPYRPELCVQTGCCSSACKRSPRRPALPTGVHLGPAHRGTPRGSAEPLGERERRQLVPEPRAAC